MKFRMLHAALLLCLTPTQLLAQGADSATTSAQSVTPRKVPGVYRIKLGKFTIVALSDGLFQLPTDQLLIDAKPGETAALLAADNEPTVQPTAVNAYLIDTGSKRILVDTGSGTYFGPTLGNVLTQLRSAGYRPEDINEVLITHLHPDHVGGLSSDGRMAFPNATVRLVDAEETFWLDKANASKVNASVQSSFDAAVASLAPYIKTGHVKSFKADADLEPGISAIALPGHTVGHTGYRVQSAGKTLLIWGDVMHVAVVQLHDPAITIKFDSVPRQAYISRMRIMDAAAKQNYLVAGAHLAFPGIGTIKKGPREWKWIPVVANLTTPTK